DPLFEWALRESGSGLASLPEGSEAGLRRLARREVIVSAIHLHHPSDPDEDANVAAVRQAPGLHDAVVIGLARREQGLLVAPGRPHAIRDIAHLAGRGLRLAQRQEGAGAQLLLLTLLTQALLDPRDLKPVQPVCAT